MLKSEFKGQILSKFDLGLLNAYNPMYFDRNTNSEFYFSIQWSMKPLLFLKYLEFDDVLSGSFLGAII